MPILIGSSPSAVTMNGAAMAWGWRERDAGP